MIPRYPSRLAIPGNFEQVTRQLLKRIPAENKIMSYVYPKEKYVFHYMVDDGITYLCMADEGFGRMIPFRFLEDLKNKFVGTLCPQIRSLFENSTLCCSDDVQPRSASAPRRRSRTRSTPTSRG